MNAIAPAAISVGWLVAAAVAVGVAASSAVSMDYPVMFTIGAAFLALTVISLHLPSGVVVRIDVVAASAALCILSPVEGILSMAVGTLMGRLLALQSREDSLLQTFGAVGRGLTCLSAGYATLAVLGVRVFAPEAGLEWHFVVIAATAYALLDLATLGIGEAVTQGSRPRRVFKPLTETIALLTFGQACLGVALVLVYPYMHAWSVLLLTLLAAVLLNGFNLYLRVRVAYRETIAALARASELGMPERGGHAKNVAEIAAAIGRDAGLTAEQLETLGYAALLHDIGAIGQAVDTTGDSDASMARAGSAILGDIPFLAGAAELVAAQVQRSANPEVLELGSASLGGAIIKASSDFDMAIRARSDRTGADACGEIVAEMRARRVYDPHILRLLERAVTSLFAAED